jgi:hypothetical protein
VTYLGTLLSYVASSLHMTFVQTQMSLQAKEPQFDVNLSTVEADVHLGLLARHLNH